VASYVLFAGRFVKEHVIGFLISFIGAMAVAA